jgi:2-C-methyl-D-erythritol 2,4-cyclodiphosphate synthase
MRDASVPRVGLGFDVHRFGGVGPLRLGGHRFEGAPGLVGHSDGDVVAHAVADALLGAAALGDVGDHFPDTDPEVAGIAGLELLADAYAVVQRDGWRATSCDLTIVCERPIIGDSREPIRVALAGTLGVDTTAISVKATRPEGLGLTGDGVGCLAIVMVVGTDAKSEGVPG